MRQLQKEGKRVTAKELILQLKAFHPYSAGHSLRVGSYAKMIARELGFSAAQAAQVNRQGVLHDMGKLLTPKEVLDKPGKLDKQEFARIQKHTTSGHIILKKLLDQHASQNQMAVAVAKLHHERPDGTGYPSRIEWEKIPLEAKIVAVADVFDAMTSQRSYNVPKTKAAALKVLQAIAGTQLDREAVNAFERAAAKLPNQLFLKSGQALEAKAPTESN